MINISEILYENENCNHITKAHVNLGKVNERPATVLLKNTVVIIYVHVCTYVKLTLQEKLQ